MSNARDPLFTNIDTIEADILKKLQNGEAVSGEDYRNKANEVSEQISAVSRFVTSELTDYANSEATVNKAPRSHTQAANAFNGLSSFVMNHILDAKNIDSATIRMEFWIAVIKNRIEQGDFHSFFSIIGAFNNTAISRLQLTDGLSGNAKATLDQLTQAIDDGRPTDQYHLILSHSDENKSVMPYHGAFKSMLDKADAYQKSEYSSVLERYSIQAKKTVPLKPDKFTTFQQAIMRAPNTDEDKTLDKKSKVLFSRSEDNLKPPTSKILTKKKPHLVFKDKNISLDPRLKAYIDAKINLINARRELRENEKTKTIKYRLDRPEFTSDIIRLEFVKKLLSNDSETLKQLGIEKISDKKIMRVLERYAESIVEMEKIKRLFLSKLQIDAFISNLSDERVNELRAKLTNAGSDQINFEGVQIKRIGDTSASGTQDFLATLSREDSSEIKLIIKLTNNKRDKSLEKVDRYLPRQFSIKEISPGSYLEISEYCENGSLEQKAKNEKIVALRRDQAAGYLKNTLDLISDFNKNGVYLPDIRLSNLLLRNDNTIIISDTKNLHIISSGQTIVATNNIHLPEKYLPERILSSNSIDLQEVQSYLIAISLYEYITGGVPAKVAGIHQFDWNHVGFSGDKGLILKKAIEGLSQKDPTARISLEDAKKILTELLPLKSLDTAQGSPSIKAADATSSATPAPAPLQAAPKQMNPNADADDIDFHEVSEYEPGDSGAESDDENDDEPDQEIASTKSIESQFKRDFDFAQFAADDFNDQYNALVKNLLDKYELKTVDSSFYKKLISLANNPSLPEGDYLLSPEFNKLAELYKVWKENFNKQDSNSEFKKYLKSQNKQVAWNNIKSKIIRIDTSNFPECKTDIIAYMTDVRNKLTAIQKNERQKLVAQKTLTRQLSQSGLTKLAEKIAPIPSSEANTSEPKTEAVATTASGPAPSHPPMIKQFLIATVAEGKKRSSSVALTRDQQQNMGAKIQKIEAALDKHKDDESSHDTPRNPLLINDDMTNDLIAMNDVSFDGLLDTLVEEPEPTEDANVKAPSLVYQLLSDDTVLPPTEAPAPPPDAQSDEVNLPAQEPGMVSAEPVADTIIEPVALEPVAVPTDKTNSVSDNASPATIGAQLKSNDSKIESLLNEVYKNINSSSPSSSSPDNKDITDYKSLVEAMRKLELKKHIALGHDARFTRAGDFNVLYVNAGTNQTITKDQLDKMSQVTLDLRKMSIVGGILYMLEQNVNYLTTDDNKRQALIKKLSSFINASTSDQSNNKKDINVFITELRKILADELDYKNENDKKSLLRDIRLAERYFVADYNKNRMLVNETKINSENYLQVDLPFGNKLTDDQKKEYIAIHSDKPPAWFANLKLWEQAWLKNNTPMTLVSDWSAFEKIFLSSAMMQIPGIKNARTNYLIQVDDTNKDLITLSTSFKCSTPVPYEMKAEDEKRITEMNVNQLVSALSQQSQTAPQPLIYIGSLLSDVPILGGDDNRLTQIQAEATNKAKESNRNLIDGNEPVNVLRVLPKINNESTHIKNLLDYYNKNQNTVAEANKKIASEAHAKLTEIQRSSRTFRDLTDNRDAYKAAYISILVEACGGTVSTNCKSGKDRTGLDELYRAAMLIYFNEHEKLPAIYDEKKDRDRFIAIYTHLFNTYKVQESASTNTPGSFGIKDSAKMLGKKEADALRDSYTTSNENAGLNKPNDFMTDEADAQKENNKKIEEESGFFARVYAYLFSDKDKSKTITTDEPGFFARVFSYLVGDKEKSKTKTTTATPPLPVTDAKKQLKAAFDDAEKARNECATAADAYNKSGDEFVAKLNVDKILEKNKPTSDDHKNKAYLEQFHQQVAKANKFVDETVNASLKNYIDTQLNQLNSIRQSALKAKSRTNIEAINQALTTFKSNLGIKMNSNETSRLDSTVLLIFNQYIEQIEIALEINDSSNIKNAFKFNEKSYTNLLDAYKSLIHNPAINNHKLPKVELKVAPLADTASPVSVARNTTNPPTTSITSRKSSSTVIVNNLPSSPAPSLGSGSGTNPGPASLSGGDDPNKGGPPPPSDIPLPPTLPNSGPSNPPPANTSAPGNVPNTGGSTVQPQPLTLPANIGTLFNDISKVMKEALESSERLNARLDSFAKAIEERNKQFAPRNKGGGPEV